MSVLAPVKGAAYGDPGYARSLAEYGEPMLLPACGGWLLRRRVPGGGRRADAMGCYPLFQCDRWSELPQDLDTLAAAGGPVSVTLVADPLGDHDPGLLERTFPDLCRPFKDHFLVDLAGDPGQFVHPHQRRNARKASRHVLVEICDRPGDHLDTWVRLYRALCRRHGIRGMVAFSREAFMRQLALPGTVLLRATERGDPVAMLLFYCRGDAVWYHLGATDERGYRHGGAANALMWEAIAHFKHEGRRVLDLGGAAGDTPRLRDGLARFKSGWSTRTAAAWLCGRVLDREAYAALVARSRHDDAAYFPAYRAGEFC